MIIHIIQDIGAFNLFFKEIYILNKKSIGENYFILTRKNNSRINFTEKSNDYTNILFVEDFSFFKIISLFKKAKVIHVEMTSTLFRPSLFFLANLFRHKLILTIHGWIFQKNNLISSFSSLLLYRIRKVFTINQSDLTILKKTYNTVEKIKTIGFGVLEERIDFSEFNYHNVSKNNPNKINLLFIGRINELKGFHILPDIIKILHQKGFIINSFNILGTVDNKRKSKLVERAISSLKSYSFVKFVGFTKDTTSYIKKSNFVVLPSLREGVSVAMCEVLALNKPLITYGCRGAFELLGDKFSACCDNFGKADVLVDIIIKFKEDNDFKKQYFDHIKNIKPSISRQINAKIISKQYLESYKTIKDEY